jgi:hypothetical protein
VRQAQQDKTHRGTDKTPRAHDQTWRDGSARRGPRKIQRRHAPPPPVLSAGQAARAWGARESSGGPAWRRAAEAEIAKGGGREGRSVTPQQAASQARSRTSNVCNMHFVVAVGNVAVTRSVLVPISIYCGL